MHSAYWFSSGRQLIYHTYIKVTIDGHGQGARDGRGSHNQDMRWLFILSPESGALGDTEAMLLINYHDADVFENNCFFNQRMSADEDINLSLRKIFKNEFPRLAFDASG